MIDGKGIFVAGATVAALMLSTGGAYASDSFLYKKNCPPYCDESGGLKTYGGRPQGKPPTPPPTVPGNNGGGGGGGGENGGHGGHGGHGGYGGHSGGKYWRRDPWWSYDYGWRPNYYQPRYYYDEPTYYEPDSEYYYDAPVARARMSCAMATRVLRNAGYRSVRATDCRGTSYSFRAIKGGKHYKVNVSARTGRIISRVRV